MNIAAVQRTWAHRSSVLGVTASAAHRWEQVAEAIKSGWLLDMQVRRPDSNASQVVESMVAFQPNPSVSEQFGRLLVGIFLIHNTVSLRWLSDGEVAASGAIGMSEPMVVGSVSVEAECSVVAGGCGGCPVAPMLERAGHGGTDHSRTVYATV